VRSVGVRDDLSRRLRGVDGVSSVELLRGFGPSAAQAAHGAALLADGLAGGVAAALVAHLAIRDATGTVLDYLHVISPEQARRTLGLV
jgi:predicted butyrate kinase (DUF1464 family)